MRERAAMIGALLLFALVALLVLGTGATVADSVGELLEGLALEE